MSHMRSHNPIADLLNQIDSHKQSLPSTDNLFQPPADIYYSVLQMYNKFKKQNQTQILQSKVYQLKLGNSEQQTMYGISPKIDKKGTKHQVTIRSFCQTYKYMGFEDIDNFLKMKEYLPENLRKDIISVIISQIKNTDKISINYLESIFKIFKSIFKSDQYFECLSNQQKRQFWRQIQQQMIQIFLKVQTNPQGFNKIAKFLFTLPGLDHRILIMISQLYRKIQYNQDFCELQKLYKYIYSMLQNQKQIQKTLNKTIVTITTPTHLQKIKLKIKNNEIDRKLIKQQAKRKMNENFTVLTNKIENIIEFIFIALLLDSQLWVDFLIWLWKLPQNCKNYVMNNRLPSLITSIFNKPVKQFIKVLELLGQNQNQYEISMFFVQKIIDNKQKLLINKKIRKFLASKIIADPSLKYWSQLLNQNQLWSVFIEIIEHKNSYQFFKCIFEDSAQTFMSFQGFLGNMIENNPVRFKQFYLKIDQFSNSKVLTLKNNYLIHFLGRIQKTDLILSILRGLSQRKPSQTCIVILTIVFSSTTSKKDLFLLKTQIIKTLNIILCTVKYEELNEVFKLHLREFSGKLQKQDANKIFKDLSDQMNQSLKQFYKEKPKIPQRPS